MIPTLGGVWIMKDMRKEGGLASGQSCIYDTTRKGLCLELGVPALSFLMANCMI